ncbi:MAG: TIGR00269 family protein [Infirmifilum sp.]|uniref:TIGR00269 family protein n=1 Tax=Infirmifilum sp. TaxID=2856575 RepID=UPI003D1080DC
MGEYLCREHFIEYFERRVYETIRHFQLIEEGDRVAVAVSGGKDSLTTLYLLTKFSKELKSEVFGVAVDEGIAGYREYKLQALSKLANDLGVKIFIGRFKDYFDMTLDEAVERLRGKGMKIKPCSVCGVFRRFIMNKMARELGATKLATGHNLDDEVQVFVMNALKAHIEGVEREGINSRTTGEGLVPRIKPLYLITEKEVLTYTLLKGIHTPFVECPYIVYALRHPIRHWINHVEDETPSFKYKVLALKELTRKLLPKPLEGAQRCLVCGEPSSRPVCKACLFRAYLDKDFEQRLIQKISLYEASKRLKSDF